MSTERTGVIPGEPGAGGPDLLLSSAVVRTLCRVALDNVDAVQHPDENWVRGPALRALAGSAVLRMPLSNFIDLLHCALRVALPQRVLPDDDALAPGDAPAPADVPGDAQGPHTSSEAARTPATSFGDHLRVLASTCLHAAQGALTPGGALPEVITALSAAYDALSDAFGLMHDGPSPRPPLSSFIAALAFDYDALSVTTGLALEQQQFASFRELMQLYELM